LFHFKIFSYSVLRLFTGCAIAAFIAWKLTVSTAISIAAIAAKAYIHNGMFALEGKSPHPMIGHRYGNLNSGFKKYFICLTPF
jgi:hydroxymethylpyrimidine/phosphomethylpyrimidine kinase